MPIQYPSSLDNFINPSSTDMLDSATVPHHTQHSDLNDAVEAIETELGVNPSSTFPTVGARIFEAERQIAEQSVLNGLTDVTISSVASGQVLRYNGSQWINYAESNLVDGGNF